MTIKKWFSEFVFDFCLDIAPTSTPSNTYDELEGQLQASPYRLTSVLNFIHAPVAEWEQIFAVRSQNLAESLPSSLEAVTAAY